MHRLLLCLLLCLLTPSLLRAQETDDIDDLPAISDAPLAAGSHAFTVGERRIYHYESHHRTRQHNLDDELVFDSLLRWRFALRAVAVDEDGADLLATIFHIQATHSGPGSRHSVDSGDPAGADDPILGHLIHLNGVSLELRWDSRAGTVTTVAGSETVIERLAGEGIDAERRRRAAATAYSPEALLVFWRSLLLQPRDEDETVALAAPLTGQAKRSWDGGLWTLESDGPARAELATSPTPLRATLEDLSGNGRVTIDDAGLLQRSEGALRATARWSALTQPARQEHHLRWQLVLLEVVPASNELRP